MYKLREMVSWERSSLVVMRKSQRCWFESPLLHLFFSSLSLSYARDCRTNSHCLKKKNTWRHNSLVPRQLSFFYVGVGKERVWWNYYKCLFRKRVWNIYRSRVVLHTNHTLQGDNYWPLTVSHLRLIFKASVHHIRQIGFTEVLVLTPW